MNCRAATVLLPLYADDDLPRDRSAELAAHLEHCTACQQRLAADRRLSTTLPAALPRGLLLSQARSERLWQRLADRIESTSSARAALSPLAALATATAVVALAALVVFAGNALSPAGSPTQGGALPSTPDTTRLAETSIWSVHMLDAQAGWGLGPAAIYRTTDGGGLWQDVTPKGLLPAGSDVSSYAFFTQSDFVDERSGFVFFRDSMEDALLRTTDGGASWSRFTIPAGTSAFDFVDPERGWLLASNSVALDARPAAVYQTLDGGASWEKVAETSAEAPQGGGALPLDGIMTGIRFLNESTGWVTGETRAKVDPILHLTRDGGRTWERQTIPTAPQNRADQVRVLLPRFVSASDGFLPILVTDANRVATFLCVTHDGGLSWQQALPLWASSISQLPGVVEYAFINQNEGWAIQTDDDEMGLLRHTITGGQQWEVVETTVSLFGTRQIGFLNSTDGWVFGFANGGTFLRKTADGGRTWADVSPNVNVNEFSPATTKTLQMPNQITVYANGQAYAFYPEADTPGFEPIALAAEAALRKLRPVVAAMIGPDEAAETAMGQGIALEIVYSEPWAPVEQLGSFTKALIVLAGEHYEKSGHVYLGHDSYDRLVPADAAAEIEQLRLILGIPPSGQPSAREYSPTVEPDTEPPAG